MCRLDDAIRLWGIVERYCATLMENTESKILTNEEEDNKAKQGERRTLHLAFRNVSSFFQVKVLPLLWMGYPKLRRSSAVTKLLGSNDARSIDA